MPRRSRIDAAGALHDIMVRGIDRIELFRGDTDSNHFAERPLDSGHGLWRRSWGTQNQKGTFCSKLKKPSSIPLDRKSGT
jgi:hypothetical protein